MSTELIIIFTFSALLIFGGVLFALISFSRNGPRAIDVNKYRSQWLTIETRLSRNDTASYTLCIIDADKLLDKALKDRGLPGVTMAERMKKCQGKWTNGNGIWAAHKLRNRLVHETDVTIDYERARQALVSYKQALKDVGAI